MMHIYNEKAVKYNIYIYVCTHTYHTIPYHTITYHNIPYHTIPVTVPVTIPVTIPYIHVYTYKNADHLIC